MASKRRAKSTHPLPARTSKGIRRLESSGNCRTDLSSPGLTSSRRRDDSNESEPSALSCTRRAGSLQHAVHVAMNNAPTAAHVTPGPRGKFVVGKRM